METAKLEAGKKILKRNIGYLTILKDHDGGDPFLSDSNGFTRNSIAHNAYKIRANAEHSPEDSFRAALVAVQSQSCYKGCVEIFICPNCELCFVHPKRFLIHFKWHTFGIQNENWGISEDSSLNADFSTKKMVYYCFCSEPFSSIKELGDHVKRGHETPILQKIHESPPIIGGYGHISIEGLRSIVYNEQTAIEFLMDYNIIPRRKQCAKEHQMYITFNASREPMWGCQKGTCRATVTVRKGTFLDKVKMTFEKFVKFVYWWASESTTIEFCRTEFGMSQNLVITWNNKLREVCVFKLKQPDSMIGGDGMMVEIDESRFVQKQRMLGGICKETNEWFFVPVPSRSIDTFLPAIKNLIRPGSLIRTDRYNEIMSLPEFMHLKTNNRFQFVDTTNAKNQQAETVWEDFGKWKLEKRGNEQLHPGTYLGEYMWRTQLKGRDPFPAILKDIALYTASQPSIKQCLEIV